ncbi:hypothetical protein L6303_02700 [archaeon]|nr:hypothetical protein [Nanoarchaeota archaeon]MBU4299862.1 hypothetical protein [Nanoarchaeota archaeon]MBU4451642.1 hypothetical protein [Nanoarchaeota archaeon]MCG2723629.1 hypothetical protein [archaeon]
MNLDMKKGNDVVAADDYAKGFLFALKKAQNDKELINIIDKIYEDGFEDGCKEGQDDGASENWSELTITQTIHVVK